MEKIKTMGFYNGTVSVALFNPIHDGEGDKKVPLPVFPSANIRISPPIQKTF